MKWIKHRFNAHDQHYYEGANGYVAGAVWKSSDASRPEGLDYYYYVVNRGMKQKGGYAAALDEAKARVVAIFAMQI